MVQSASASVTDDHLHKRSIKKSKRVLEKSLFCAATSLHFDIKHLSSNLTVPAAPETNFNIKTVINATFDHFSTPTLQELYYSNEFKVPGTRSLI